MQGKLLFFQVASACPCGCHERLKLGSVIAAEVRQAILHDTGLTCCAGIAHNKLLAKLVAGWRKPNMQTTLLPEDAESLLSGLQARDIPGITSGKVNIVVIDGFCSKGAYIFFWVYFHFFLD